MVYQKEVHISLSDNKANLMFQNPSKSVNDIVLQLVIISEDGTETVIAQSGTLSSGYKIEQLDLIKMQQNSLWEIIQEDTMFCIMIRIQGRKQS